MPQKRKSAFNAALEAAQQGQTVTPSHSETVKDDQQKETTPLDSETLSLQDASTVQESHRDTVSPLSSTTATLQQGRMVEGESSKTLTQSDSSSVSPQHSETVETPHNITVKPLDSDTVTQQKSETVKNIISSEVNTDLEQQREALTLSYSETVLVPQEKDRFTAKISFYLTPEQGDKLDDLAHDFKKKHKKRINRNDIVRYLIDTCTLETLNELKDQ